MNFWKLEEAVFSPTEKNTLNNIDENLISKVIDMRIYKHAIILFFICI
jgi:hypothetical protein